MKRIVIMLIVLLILIGVFLLHGRTKEEVAADEPTTNAVEADREREQSAETPDQAAETPDGQEATPDGGAGEKTDAEDLQVEVDLEPGYASGGM